MAQLEDKAFLQEIEKGNLRSHYFLIGEEIGKLNFYLEQIEARVLPQGRNSFNYECFYADEIKAADLLDSCRSASLFQGRRLILIKRIEKFGAKDMDALFALIEDANMEHTLVFCAEKLDGRGKLSQAITKNKSAHIGIVKCEALKEFEWSQWLPLLLKKRKLKVSPDAREALLQMGFASIVDLDQALEKLSLFVGDGPIEMDDFSKIQFWGKPESVFAFTEAITKKQTKAALEFLLKLEAQGDEALQLLALVARQFRIMNQIAVLKKQGKGEQQISSELRLFPRQASGLFAGVTRRTARDLNLAIAKIAKADLSIKSTREPPFRILERLSTELCT